MQNSILIGAFGEANVEAKLLEFGFYVAKPCVDAYGHDILAGTHPNHYWTIQVKTCKAPTIEPDRPSSRYLFPHLAKGVQGADFYILFCARHHSFYVVPGEHIKTKCRVSGCGVGDSPIEKYFEAWHLLKEPVK